jgi:hypothetical protein
MTENDLVALIATYAAIVRLTAAVLAYRKAQRAADRKAKTNAS